MFLERHRCGWIVELYLHENLEVISVFWAGPISQRIWGARALSLMEDGGVFRGLE